MIARLLEAFLAPVPLVWAPEAVPAPVAAWLDLRDTPPSSSI